MTAHRPRPVLTNVLSDLEAFSHRMLPRFALRTYQLAPARAILDSVNQGRGDQFAIVFSRQAGKDEMLVQLLALTLYQRSRKGGSVVVAAPTLMPQALITRNRLRDRLLANPLTRTRTRVAENTVRVGKAQVHFASAAPAANARGLTADLLLVANEAQGIDIPTWDAVFDPMTASTNATIVYMGTVWSNTTLLARQMRHLGDLETRDGRQRVWLVPWEVVARDVPAYGEKVRARIAQFGHDHAFVRTEFRLEELDGEGGLFPHHRIVQMQGDHPRQDRARPGGRYALLIDVGGEEETAIGIEPTPDGRRDSTALTVVEVDTGERADGLPVYRVVDRRLWTGTRHAALHAELVRLARETWKAEWVVVDATGVGAGLASFLKASLGQGHPRITVEPFVFSMASKSQLGWDFLSLIDSGRYREYRVDGEPDAVTAEYLGQLRATEYETRNGPGNLLRWSVPARSGHDDLVISAALCGVLDQIDYRPRIARGHSPPPP